MKPDARRAAPLANARLELTPFPDRDGQHDKDGVLATLPDCPHCGGRGYVDRDPCGCGEPEGFREWIEETLVDIGDAPSLRALAHLLARRGAYLLQSLDRLQGQIRRGEIEAPAAEPPPSNLWEATTDTPPVEE